MSVLPLVNATLTKIAGGGTTEDYDTAAGTDTQRLAGSEDAYVVEDLLSEVSYGRLDQVEFTLVVVLLAVGALVLRGDTISFDHAGQTRSRTVRAVEQRRLMGTVRLTCWET